MPKSLLLPGFEPETNDFLPNCRLPESLFSPNVLFKTKRVTELLRFSNVVLKRADNDFQPVNQYNPV
jgi:hypothetical protein